MEDFLDSRAAVEAMAALQEKMKELEAENDGLRKEVVRLRGVVENSENELAEREKAMTREAERAQKMLESAAETLVELRRIRIENRTLESQIDHLELQLRDKMAKEKARQSKIEASLGSARHKELLESELEDLFALLLSPPEYSFDEKMNVKFNPTIKSVTTYSLPANIQTVVQYIQNLPVPFSAQRIGIKKDIVNTLMKGRAICCKLIEDIHKLELSKLSTKATRQVQGDIDAKKAQLFLLMTTISKFSLS